MKKKTRYVILGLLRDEAMTGYELKNCIDLRMSFFWQESFGQIYPELSQMEKEGLIKCDEETEKDSRGKTKYTITEEGRHFFDQWMKEEYEKDTVRSEAMLKFFLADDHNKKDIINHLEKFNKQNQTQFELFKKFYESMKGFEEIHNHRYILHMIDLGMRQQKLYCDWSESYIKELKQDEL